MNPRPPEDLLEGEHGNHRPSYFLNQRSTFLDPGCPLFDKKERWDSLVSRLFDNPGNSTKIGYGSLMRNRRSFGLTFPGFEFRLFDNPALFRLPWNPDWSGKRGLHRRLRLMDAIWQKKSLHRFWGAKAGTKRGIQISPECLHHVSTSLEWQKNRFHRPSASDGCAFGRRNLSHSSG